ncbi:MAG: hypothetical protein EBU18_04405 [Rhodobacteraceae bacterium]|nr:hypothetical protein [Paracoccaceae bacterium]
MFRADLASCADAVQAHLDTYLVAMGDTHVVQAMRYTLQGGKRMRAFLVMESARLFDISNAQSIWPAAGIPVIG